MIGHSDVKELFSRLQEIHQDTEIKVTSPEGTAIRTGFLTIVADAPLATVIAFDINRIAEKMAGSSLMKLDDLTTGWDVQELENGKLGIYHPDVYYDERGTDSHDLDDIPEMTKITG